CPADARSRRLPSRALTCIGSRAPLPLRRTRKTHDDGDGRAHLSAGEAGDAVRLGQDPTLDPRDGAEIAQGGGSSVRLARLRRYRAAGAAEVPDQGGGNQLRQATRHRIPAVRAARADRAAEVLCRQFHPQDLTNRARSPARAFATPRPQTARRPDRRLPPRRSACYLISWAPLAQLDRATDF